MSRRLVEFLLWIVLSGSLVFLMQSRARVAWPEPGPGAATSAWRIDLATAGRAELEMLPGIGPVRSRAIIELRSLRPGIDVQDLALVSGIGPMTIRRLIESGLIRRTGGDDRRP
ncbi:MAG: hypothetical protein CMJ40_11755 [Phycisphaerae bacterium]|nr:hypothetical protein [Phycisphaerae bacterium]